MPRQSIIPPVVLDNLEKNAVTAEARLAARRTSLLSERMRGTRIERAVEPNAGEAREIYDAAAGTTLPGRRVRREDEPDGDDDAVNEAYDGAGHTYSLFFGEYKRRSIDGDGETLVGTVHYDRDFDNAFWDGTQMVYGDGHFFNRFTSDISVIGHELTHGVIQHTCALVYRDQPGALNEHLADAFGALTMQRAGDMAADDPRAWLIGAALVAGRIQGRALRDMLNGGAYNDPVIGKDDSRTHLRDLYTGSEDDGGVHINSGIPNRAFALACRTVPGPAWLTMGPVWYDVMANRIGPRATFAEFAAATLAAATARNASYAATVREAWASVGIDAEAVPPAEPGGGSPCGPELIALLETPGIVRALRAVAGDPAARRATVRFLSRVRRGLSR